MAALESELFQLFNISKRLCTFLGLNIFSLNSKAEISFSHRTLPLILSVVKSNLFVVYFLTFYLLKPQLFEFYGYDKQTETEKFSQALLTVNSFIADGFLINN